MNLIHRALVAILVCLTLAAAVSPAPAQTPATCQELRVMTFNIRYGTAQDGEDHWSKRKGLTFGVISEHKPDVVGLQEALRFQIDEILAAVPGYALLGVGRDDGKMQGEHAAILYRTDRLKVGQHGNFWFSDTPNAPGSKHWGNQITRMCTWARFESLDGGNSFYLFNVHLDHQSQPSREKSVQLLLERIDDREFRDPVIATGDFNAGESNPAVTAMKRAFKDSFRMLHPEATDVATFNGFKNPSTGTDKIDHIFVGPSVEVREAAILRDQTGGRFPSDHFPVTATVCIPRK
ncbi:MAG: endonuclease/exonuclease/phosphatase family protein [Acidobacteria bacterium]|nr:MAG: endonuclease/exonuclease/phosphatase family protein [Acidobacteriota bacterium]